ncbi:MAG: ABC transporter ATP-binding protein [Planctomycetota bacterium]|nr:ABC transporter ATP-binding protein [Planctomycetota bacterium]
MQSTQGQHGGIIARGLVKRFGRIVAVDNLSLDVEPGSVVGFLGHNGAGKTTSMRMICGVLPPSEGSIQVGGHDLQTHRGRAARIVGYLPEGSPLYPEMRVAEYLLFRSRLYVLPNPAGAISRAVDRCGLSEVVNRPIGHLSRGYRQRVGLAAAILHDPAVLVLDEPTSGLDPLQVIEVRQLIEELSADRTILLSTHVLQEVEAICDRVILLARGRLVAEGDLPSLRRESGMEDASLEDLFVALTAKAFSEEGVVS